MIQPKTNIRCRHCNKTLTCVAEAMIHVCKIDSSNRIKWNGSIGRNSIERSIHKPFYPAWLSEPNKKAMVKRKHEKNSNLYRLSKIRL